MNKLQNKKINGFENGKKSFYGVFARCFEPTIKRFFTPSNTPKQNQKNTPKKKHQFLISIFLIGLSSQHALATTNLVSHGTSLTTGPISDHRGLFGGIQNPAMADLLIAKDEHWRFGFMSITSATELGQVDDFVDDLNDLIDILDDPAVNTDPIDQTLAKFNRVIQQAGEEGYLKTTGGGYLPASLIYWRPDFLPGSFSFEFTIETQIRASVLADELIYDDQKTSFITSTSAYLKSGLQQKLAIGYGQKINFAAAKARDAELHVGAKLNIYDLGLSKQVFQLQLLDGKDIDKVVEDEYENNLIRSTGIGIDVGAVWLAETYSLGATLRNLNAPSFDYGSVGFNCDQYTTGTAQRSNCEIAKSFADEQGAIDKFETHKKLPVITLDGNYRLSPSWLIAANADLTSYDNTIGQEEQWATLALQYFSGSKWIPGLRTGYQKNLAGSKLDYFNFGLSIAKNVNFDFSVALKNVVIEGDKLPRGFGFSFSIEEHF